MDLSKLAAAATAHDQQLGIAEESLRHAQEALETARAKHEEIASLTVGDLPGFADWVSGFGATQLNQLRARLRLLRKDSANFRAAIATRLERMARHKRERV